MDLIMGVRVCVLATRGLFLVRGFVLRGGLVLGGSDNSFIHWE